MYLENTKSTVTNMMNRDQLLKHTEELELLLEESETWFNKRIRCLTSGNTKLSVYIDKHILPTIDEKIRQKSEFILKQIDNDNE